MMQSELDAIKARLKAATPRQWRIAEDWGYEHEVWTGDGTMLIYTGHTRADADFIAHAPDDIATLLAENERLLHISKNLAYQCQIILDYWPEFQVDMMQIGGKQLWRMVTTKYLDALENGAE